VQTRSGPVLAAAGVDASDVAAGTVLLLPQDPDASARALRARFAELTGRSPAVLVTDTAGRPWREGVTDFALGAAGLACLQDHRGTRDRSGRVLDVTVRAVADEVAAMADLVKGKAAGTPIAVVSGMGAHVTREDGDGARGCVRVGPGDWFAFGHVEAVRASLGVLSAAGADPVAPPPIGLGEPVGPRLGRAVLLAAHAHPPGGGTLEPGEGSGDLVAVRGGTPVLRGVLAQRLLSALWSEGLAGELVVTGDEVAVRLRPPSL
jgi:coenzyme F420-0:L-glutamate ligase/coenzyme F420-1:gamma-L-glutamate ligase